MAEYKRTRMTAVIAWLFVLAGGYHGARAVYDNFVLADMFSSPGVLMGLATATLPVELPPLALLAVQHIRAVFVLYMLVSLSVFATGIGLLLRRAWAIRTAKIIFYSAAVLCFTILFFPGLLVPKPYILNGVPLTPDFNAAVGGMRLQLRIIALLFGAVALRVATRFEPRAAVK